MQERIARKRGFDIFLHCCVCFFRSLKINNVVSIFQNNITYQKKKIQNNIENKLFRKKNENKILFSLKKNNFLLKYRILKIIYFILIQNNFKNNFFLKFEVIGLCNKKCCCNKL